jgi:hypothetical protein
MNSSKIIQSQFVFHLVSAIKLTAFYCKMFHPAFYLRILQTTVRPTGLSYSPIEQP